MSARLDKSWSVLASHQTREGNRCVDIFSRPDGTYGFEEFRKDPEDMGAWTPVQVFDQFALDVSRPGRPTMRVRSAGSCCKEAS